MKHLFLILIAFSTCFSATGNYCNGDKKICLQLKPDNKFVYVENEDKFFGIYTIICEELNLAFDGVDEKSFLEREKELKLRSISGIIENKCSMAAAFGVPLEDLKGKRYNITESKRCIKDYENSKTIKELKEKIKTMKFDKNQIKQIIEDKQRNFSSIETLIYKNSITLIDGYGKETILTNGSGIVYYPHKYYCSNGVLKEKENEFTDSRDGKKYKYVTIGNQTWMAENLNYHGGDGYLGLCRDKEPKNCEKYGRFYDWAETMGIDRKYNKEKFGFKQAKAVQGICPEGWHLPSDKEWKTLINFAGGEKIAGKKLTEVKKSPKRFRELEPQCKYTTEDDRGRVTEHDNCSTGEYGFSANQSVSHGMRACFFLPLEGALKSDLESRETPFIYGIGGGDYTDAKLSLMLFGYEEDDYAAEVSKIVAQGLCFEDNNAVTYVSLRKESLPPVRCIKD